MSKQEALMRIADLVIGRNSAECEDEHQWLEHYSSIFDQILEIIERV
jgi:hypothetical protein